MYLLIISFPNELIKNPNTVMCIRKINKTEFIFTEYKQCSDVNFMFLRDNKYMSMYISDVFNDTSKEILDNIVNLIDNTKQEYVRLLA